MAELTEAEQLKKCKSEAKCTEEIETCIEEARERNESWTDKVNTYYSNVATAFAIGNDTVAIYNEIANSLNQEKSKCQSQDETTEPTDEDDFTVSDMFDKIGTCLYNPDGYDRNDKPTGCNSDLHAFWESGDILGMLDTITKSKSISSCISPYFDKFINLVPYQFYISKLIEDSLGASLKGLLAVMSPQQKEEFWKDTPCDRELMEKTFNIGIGKDIPPLPQIPALPPIPYIKIPSLLQIVRNIFIDYFCWAMCCVLNNLLKFSTLQMNKMNKWVEDPKDWALGAETSTEEPRTISEKYGNLKKIDLNEFITDEILEDLKENRYVSATATIAEIRDFLRVVSSEETEMIQQKHIIYLLMGEADCHRLNFLLKLAADSYSNFELDTEERLMNFFKFLGQRMNVFALIGKSQEGVCLPDYCVEIDDDMIKQFQQAMEDLCKLMNPEFLMPEIPIELLIKVTEADSTIVSSIEVQMEMLYEQAKDAFGISPDDISYKGNKYYNQGAPGIVIKDNQYSSRVSKENIEKLFSQNVAGKTLKNLEDFDKLLSNRKLMLSTEVLRDLKPDFEYQRKKLERKKKQEARQKALASKS